MSSEKVVKYGQEREVNDQGYYRCLKCERFTVIFIPGRAPNKYCTACGKAKKAENLSQTYNKKELRKKKAREQKLAMDVDLEKEKRERNKDRKIFGYVTSPAGDEVPVISPEEQDFYEARMDKLLKEYDFTGAELDLLKTFLQLSLEEKRLQAISIDFEDPRLVQNLIKISENKLQVQKSLGLTREQRLDRTKLETVEEAIEKIIVRFKDFREKNGFKFVWKCKHCGSKNTEERINPNYKELMEEDKILPENRNKILETTPVVDKLSPTESSLTNNFSTDVLVETTPLKEEINGYENI